MINHIFRICRWCTVWYFKCLCVYEKGDNDAMKLRVKEKYPDYNMAEITPPSTKDNRKKKW